MLRWLVWLWLGAFPAQAADNSTLFCQNLLRRTPCELTGRSHLPTLRVGQRWPGQHGGQRVVVERIGQSWGSNFAKNRYDIQGDPRWFLGAAGCSTAQFFGFEYLNAQLITVPDQQEFSGAIAKVNLALRGDSAKTIPIQFYHSPDVHFSYARYLDRFIRERALPIAPAGNHFLHDISFHSGAIFIPDELLEAGVQRMAYINEFAIQLEAEGQRDLALALRRSMVESIDVATASQNLLLLAADTHPQTARVIADQISIIYSGNPRVAPQSSPRDELMVWLKKWNAEGQLSLLDQFSQRHPYGERRVELDITARVRERLVQIQRAVARALLKPEVGTKLGVDGNQDRSSH